MFPYGRGRGLEISTPIAEAARITAAQRRGEGGVAAP